MTVEAVLYGEMHGKTKVISYRVFRCNAFNARYFARRLRRQGYFVKVSR